jgi:iron-sulfur cluster repair protein YtfE (RIC family)
LPPPFKANCSPLHAISVEHKGITEAIKQLRDLIPLRIPNEAVEQSALMLGLDALARDTRDHVYIEEFVLFPRALEIERALRVDAA